MEQKLPPEHKFVSVACSKCGYLQQFVADCKDRTCAFCQRKRQTRIVQRFKPIVSVMNNPLFMTLTVQRTPLCRNALRRLRNSFTRLRHAKILKKCVGGIYQIELGKLDDLNMCNLHIHAICDSPYIPQPELSRAWMQATRGWGKIVDVRRAYDVHNALSYLTKHMGKRIHVKPEQVAYVNKVLENTRMIQGFGCLCHIRMRCWDTVCPKCGAVNSYVSIFDPLWSDVINLREASV
jgi:hypothetical protein